MFGLFYPVWNISRRFGTEFSKVKESLPYDTYYNLRQKVFHTNIYIVSLERWDYAHEKAQDSIRPQLNSKTKKEGGGVEVGRELPLLRCSPETKNALLSDIPFYCWGQRQETNVLHFPSFFPATKTFMHLFSSRLKNACLRQHAWMQTQVRLVLAMVKFIIQWERKTGGGREK